MCWICSLAPLVSKLKEPQVETMVEALCSNMTSEKEQLRDISSMALKTIIAQLSSSGGIQHLPVPNAGLRGPCLPPVLCCLDGSAGVTMTASVCRKITSQLIVAMEKQEDVLVQLEALDILSDMLGRYEPSWRGNFTVWDSD